VLVKKDIEKIIAKFVENGTNALEYRELYRLYIGEKYSKYS